MKWPEMVQMWRRDRAIALRQQAHKVRRAYTKGELGVLCRQYAADLDKAAELIERGHDASRG